MRFINKYNFSFLISVILLGYSCQPDEFNTAKAKFEELSSSQTGISFSNTLLSDRDFNIYTYRNFYNGGGVAIGDINGDSLSDIYFTANMGENKLYLNKGNFAFDDITNKAKVGGNKAWSTGVTMADVNGDGHLDIYVCNSGDVKGDNKSNELFINDGTGQFTERASDYGIDNEGYSTHAVFFDYDKDGDLDLYLLNNSYQAIGSFNLRDNKRSVRDQEGGDKLYRNEGDNFVDVSESAGIYGSVIGFGLGVTVGDINNDNWPDIYVSNDFFERDYMYTNNQDGTFSEVLEDNMSCISAASMGADMADMNNDLMPDIFVTEMLPGNDDRLKTKTTFDDWDRYSYNLSNGYYHQFNRNMLHLGNEDHTFTECGRQAGVHATDWSWGALMADFDNDGWKDLFIANGIYQDLTDQDFLNYIADGDVMKSMIEDDKVNYAKLIEAIPSNKIKNCLFQNLHNNEYQNVADEWGLGKPSHSNGAAYGDLDNDGDLDLIVNNVNMPSFVYRNNTVNKNWIQIVLKGKGKNTMAINSKIIVTSTNGMQQYFEFIPQKGFQSSMDYVTHVGLGDDTAKQIEVIWNDGKRTLLNNPENKSRIYIDQRDAQTEHAPSAEILPAPLLINVTDGIALDYLHSENNYVDFDRERLLYNMKSTSGPSVAIADLNGDGADDLIFGGAANEPTSIYLWEDNRFVLTPSEIFEKDKAAEVKDLQVHDFDNDGDLDILSIHGGIEFTRESSSIIDAYYTNDGGGLFTRGKRILPSMGLRSNGTSTKGDYNGDGNTDLFVAENLKPYLYGVPGDGTVMSLEGSAPFKNMNVSDSQILKSIGLITTSASADLNQDGLSDLIVAGEYTPIYIYYGSKKDGLIPIDEVDLPDGINGWWNTIETADLDGDGDLDIVLGNHGNNSRFQASTDHPVFMYVNDFDKNGTVEQIICTFNGEKTVPLALRHDLVRQLPSLKKKYLKYSDYVDQSMEDIFTEEEMANMITLKADELRSVVLMNENGKFIKKPLPRQAQLSPIYAIESKDVNNDGTLDLILGGNLYKVKPEVGRYDATDGLVLIGIGDGSFNYESDQSSGFDVAGEIRAIESITIKDEDYILVARNNDRPMFFKMGKQ